MPTTKSLKKIVTHWWCAPCWGRFLRTHVRNGSHGHRHGLYGCGFGIVVLIELWVPVLAHWALDSTFWPTRSLAKTPWAVFVGAIPGAIPFMLGWAAATNDFDIESGTLFAIQFIWQFLTFWAIGWLAYDDYKKAGYSCFPIERKTEWPLSKPLPILYGWCLWPLFPCLVLREPSDSLVERRHHRTVGSLLGVTWVLYKQRTNEAARAWCSDPLCSHLIQIIYVIDKFATAWVR